MMKQFLFAIIAAASMAHFFIPFAFAQNTPIIQWAKSYGGSNDDRAFSIQPTKDEGYIIAGFSGSDDSEVTGNHHNGTFTTDDYWIVKINETGNIAWQRTLGGSGEDRAYSIQQTNDGGYIVAGWSNSTDGDVTGNHGGFDFWVVKLDTLGNIEWQKSLGGSGSDYAYQIQQTDDDGYVVIGSSSSTDGDVTGNHGWEDYWIVKLDRLGRIEWQKSLGGSGDDVGTTVEQTKDGGYIVAGASNSTDGEITNNLGNYDFWVVKLDTAGNIEWQKTLGGSVNDLPNSIQQTSDEGYVVAGMSLSIDGDVTGNHGGGDYWIVKLDKIGNMLWEKALGGSSLDAATCIRQTNDSGYVVAGYSLSTDGDIYYNHGGSDYWIIKLDNNGKIVWQKSLGGSADDRAYCVQPTNVDGYIIAGISNSTDGNVVGNHGGYDYWIVKLNYACMSSNNIHFDSVPLGVCRTDTLCFSNTGFAPDTLTALNFLGKYAGSYSIANMTYKILQPGEGEQILITFCPAAADTEDAVAALVVGTGDTVFVQLFGAGYQPVAVAEPVAPAAPLLQNYPNPFSSSTHIVVSAAAGARVTVTDMLGRQVASLVPQSNGQFVWTPGACVQSGTYFIVVKTKAGVTVKPVALLR